MTTYSTVRANFSLRSQYSIDLDITTQYVTGGTQVTITNQAVKHTEVSNAPFSSGSPRSYSTPNGRTSSPTGNLAESGSDSAWAFTFTYPGVPQYQNIWGASGYFTRYYADSDSIGTIEISASHSLLGSATASRSGVKHVFRTSFDANGGSVGTSYTDADSGNSITLPTPSRSGYTFNGWYTAASGGTYRGGAGSSYTVTATDTLYAQWSVATITITFDFQGGSGSPSSKTINVGDAIGTLPSPTQGTYNFVGWYTTVGPTGGSSVNTSTTFSSATTIYARWESTVSFNANGGTSVSAVYVPKGNTLDVTTSSFNSARSGFSFLGWYATTTGGTKYTSFIPTGSITLYANWQGTVTYDEQGGTTVPDVTFVLGNSVSLPSPTRAGYSLSGWYTAASGGSSVGTAGQSYTPSSSLTLYARWAALSVSWSNATLDGTARKNSSFASTSNDNSVAVNYANSWTVSWSPSAPSGLTFNQGTSTTGSSTSTLTGTPTVYGTYTLSITPVNADGISGATYSYDIEIADVALAWSDQVLASSIATESVSYTDGVSVVSGPTTTYSEKVANSLPPGLSINSSTGAITGTPTTAGSYDFVIVATNGTGETIETSTLTITVEAAGGYVKVWNGTTWANGIVYVRQSGQWVEGTAKVRNASSGWTDSFSS